MKMTLEVQLGVRREMTIKVEEGVREGDEKNVCFDEYI